MRRISKTIFTYLISLIILGNLLFSSDFSDMLHTDKAFAATSRTFAVYTGSGEIKSLTSVKTNANNTLPLIIDSKKVDYMSYIPEIVPSSNVKNALDISNPKLSIDAASAVLINADTGEVLFHKDPVAPIFPSSTVKLLSSLVALDWCKTDEKITVGNEINLIPSDASKANLKKGEKLTVSTLLSAMLLPSGNDAAYVMAVYVGRKSLNNSKASLMKSVNEFVRLMNEKAKKLGAENSCFITPDGYDAIGQYTTAYDMALISMASVKSKTILKIAKKCSVTATLISGEKHTWYNTNALINKDSIWYNSNAIGLKTGTTTMAGRCLISAASNENGTVISIVMNSTIKGRWNDSNKLLDYGLKSLEP